MLLHHQDISTECSSYFAIPPGYKSHGSADVRSIDSSPQSSHLSGTSPHSRDSGFSDGDFPVLNTGYVPSAQTGVQFDAAELALLNKCLGDGEIFAQPPTGQATSVLVNGEDLTGPPTTTSEEREISGTVPGSGQNARGSASRSSKHCAEREDKRLSGPTAFMSNAVVSDSMLQACSLSSFSLRFKIYQCFHNKLYILCSFHVLNALVSIHPNASSAT